MTKVFLHHIKVGEYMETIVLPIKELLILGVLIEAVIQVVKPLLPSKLSENGILFLSMALGVIFALTLKVSIFANVGNEVVYAGSVIAGMIASRGSNFIHDFVSAMADIGKSTK